MKDAESKAPLQSAEPPWPSAPETFEDFGMDADKLALYACSFLPYLCAVE